MAGRDPGADRDDARDAERTGAFDEEGGGLVAPVEVGVRVDHRRLPSLATGASRRGKSGGAASIPSVSPVSP